MASKTPFIVSRMKFVQDFLEENLHCLMANPEDIKEWSSKINYLLENPEVGAKIQANAYKLYKKIYMGYSSKHNKRFCK